MLPIAFISFRESLEMLLVGGAIYSALVEHKIQRKRELIMGAGLGLVLSIFIFIIVSFAGSKIHFDVHEWGEILEGINYMGTGIFLLLTAIFLHTKMKQVMSLSPSTLLNTSIFAVGFLSVLREGIEITFFNISNAIGASFTLSFFGLLLGIGTALIVGTIGIRFAATRVSHRALLLASDWGIRILSLYFIAKGMAGLAEFIL